MCFTCSIRRELRMTGLDAAVINAHTKGCGEIILYWNPGRCLIINQPATSKENFTNIDFYFILDFQFNVMNWRFQQTKIMHNMFLWKTYCTIVSSILIFMTYNLKRGIPYGKILSLQDFEKYTEPWGVRYTTPSKEIMISCHI